MGEKFPEKRVSKRKKLVKTRGELHSEKPHPKPKGGKKKSHIVNPKPGGCKGNPYEGPKGTGGKGGNPRESPLRGKGVLAKFDGNRDGGITNKDGER